MRRPLTNAGLAFTLLFLSFVSFRVTVMAAGMEPFTSYSTTDALYYVGFASVLMLLWVQMAAAIAIGVACKRVSAWWYIAAILSVVGVFGLYSAVDTWTSDIQVYAFTLVP